MMTVESVLVLLVALAVAVWPVMVKAGMVWGRMQAEDEMARRMWAVRQEVHGNENPPV